MDLESLDEFILKHDNSKSFVNIYVPEACKNEPCILGVDEAGRGPVLGPMVYGIAFCPKKEESILTDLGCADSKQLNEEKREEIFVEMHQSVRAKKNVGWATEVISPNVISSSMYRRTKYSLNEISMGSAIDLIQKTLDVGVRVSEIYVDTVGPPEKYQAKLAALFPGIKVTVAKKADSTYPIVSAASICAKVTRDHALKLWKFREGIDVKEFGSGYPNDPNTKKFLGEVEAVFGFPRIVRFSWQTSETALEKTAHNMEFEEEVKETKMSFKSKKMTEFFQNENGGSRPRHKFFKEKCLEITADF